ncbi:hypothetical protein [Chryseobacterium sp. CCH4-E10]|uniref:hypothetical protein n=1 Tax=Chryseobacterium sp. CCH4-E10 TaxID=1768758 RepID=UPI00082B0D8A|nr:hypothetical protein [Chryseobacterium sp. CCH4-E10]
MNKNAFKPVLGLIAIILGFVIYKHLDLRTMTLKDPLMDALYIITLVICIFLLFRSRGQSSKELEK